MQCLYLLLLVAMCQSLVNKVVEEPVLPKPTLLSVTALDPPALQVEWELVDDVPAFGPIKGYKILVWELRPVESSEYKMVNGVVTMVEGFRPPTFSDIGLLSEDDAIKIVVSDPLISKAQVRNIKLNSIYEVRVRAFTESKDGPLSSHLSVQLLDKTHTFGKAY